MVRRIDLHAHTTVSDGTLTPAALARLAAREGLSAIAVTDHDHVGGIAGARAAGGVEVVSGIELSAHAGKQEVHLLGYLFDESNERLLSRLDGLRAARERRAGLMVEKLASLGVRVELPVVAGAVGRPHVARALVDAGHASSIQDAFDKFLADGKPAFVSKEKLSAAEAISLVHGAGGVVSFAHPVLVKEPEATLRALVAEGLDAVEVAHSKHSPEFRAQVSAWARELSLVETGGSDFHGENKPDVRLGMMDVPYATLDALRVLIARR